jgi:hypothetical protein
MISPQLAQTRFPDWLRWTVLAWFVIWLPAYWHTWGAANFLHLCDIAVMLTCLAVWSNSALLISTQAVGSLLVDAAWALDAGWRLVSGRGLMGTTEYLFDPHFPLWIRLLTLFHLVMPGLVLWALYRTGYDRRGWALQSAIALAAFIASRFTSPAENINFAFTDPFFHRAWGSPPVHILTSWLFMAFVLYLPTHLLLKHLFAPPGALRARRGRANRKSGPETCGEPTAGLRDQP